MVRKLLPLVLVVAAVSTMCSAPAEAANRRASGDLFYNYYVPPGDAGDVGAQMYLSPRPTPPLVGHTYVTYQPLMPHEFLYPHKRHYVRYHPCRGYTKTTVHWKRDWVNLGKTPRPYTSIPLKKWFHEEF